MIVKNQFKRKVIMKIRPVTLMLTAVLLIIAGVVSCKLVALDYDTPPLEQLEVGATEISNWKPEATMKVFIGDKLYDLIDGGAPQYLDKGCKKTGFQRLTGPNGASVEIKIMDFGKDINATAMFTEMQMNNVGQTVKDNAFPDTTSNVVPNMGGVSGYAHFANYYFELAVTGFSDQALAISTYDMFFRLFEKKLNM